MNKKDKQENLEAFIKNISRLSDEKYQERVWVRVEGPECDDIDDAVCDFFDDGGHILENYKNFEITEAQHKLLITLRDKLNNFKHDYHVYSPYKSTEKLIQLPEWKEIRKLSKDVIRSFNFQQKK
jgi:hypothetical protein